MNDKPAGGGLGKLPTSFPMQPLLGFHCMVDFYWSPVVEKGGRFRIKVLYTFDEILANRLARKRFRFSQRLVSHHDILRPMCGVFFNLGACGENVSLPVSIQYRVQHSHWYVLKTIAYEDKCPNSTCPR